MRPWLVASVSLVAQGLLITPALILNFTFYLQIAVFLQPAQQDSNLRPSLFVVWSSYFFSCIVVYWETVWMAYFLRLTTGPESVRYRRVPSVWVLELVKRRVRQGATRT